MPWYSKYFKQKSPSEAVNNFVTMVQGENTGDVLSANRNWVFVAVDRISSSCSGVRFKVMQKRAGGDVEVTNGPLVDFLNNPNPVLTWRDIVYLNSAYKELAGNGLWRVKNKQIYPLLPTKVRPIIKDGVLMEYEYQNGGKTEKIPVEEVVHDKYPDPKNPYWGIGPLSKIAGWVDTDNYASEFNRLFFINGATFGGVIETDEESKERIELIKIGLKRDHVGVKNSHKWAVLPKNSTFKQVSQTMKDMQFSELDVNYRDKILSGFGVPKTLVGLTTEVNRASAEASEYIFAKYTIEPKVLRFVDFLNKRIVPLFGKSQNLYFDYDEFIPVNEEIALKEIELALNKQPYMTINEVRGMKGLAPVKGGDELGGQPVIPPTKAVFKDSLDLMLEKIVDVATPTLEKKKDFKEFVARVDKYREMVESKIKDFNLKQKNQVLQNLGRITKAVAKKDLFNMDSEVAILVDFVSPLLGGLLNEQAIDEYTAEGFEGNFNPSDLNVSKIVESVARRMSESYNDTTADLLKKALNEGLEAGEGLNELTKRVQEIYEFSDSYRAGMVAHTETFYIANKANLEAYRQSGVVKTVKWYVEPDACQFCKPLAGKEVKIGEDFFKKGESHTGDEGGSMTFDYRGIDVPPLHPNCRCFVKAGEISVFTDDKDFIKELDELLNE